MKPLSLPHPRGIASAAMLGAALMAGTAMAASVTMPTSTGPRSFDTASFAAAIEGAPSGAVGCFTAGSVEACTPASLQLAVLGPDLTTGLSLGGGAQITLLMPGGGTSLAIWEAGNFAAAGDVSDSLVSVHSASGWSGEHTYGPGHVAPVLGDTQPSGYATNFGTFSAADLGLAPGASIDAVRIRSCCGVNAHADILAVAAVPEPGTAALLLPGLLGLGWLARRRRQP